LASNTPASAPNAKVAPSRTGAGRGERLALATEADHVAGRVDAQVRGGGRVLDADRGLREREAGVDLATGEATTASVDVAAGDRSATGDARGGEQRYGHEDQPAGHGISGTSHHLRPCDRAHPPDRKAATILTTSRSRRPA